MRPTRFLLRRCRMLRLRRRLPVENRSGACHPVPGPGWRGVNHSEGGVKGIPMASGDAQRTWFPEMIETWRQAWSPSMSEDDLMALRDALDAMLQTIRHARHIRPAMMWCPRCQERHRSTPPSVSVRAMILALGRFEIASASEVKALERRWNTYRRHHHLDRYGMPGEAGAVGDEAASPSSSTVCAVAWHLTACSQAPGSNGGDKRRVDRRHLLS